MICSCPVVKERGSLEMKKTRLILLAILVMVSTVGFTQITLKNASQNNIRVYSTDGMQSVNVPMGTTVSVPFLKEANGVTVCRISHSAYKPGSSFIWTSDGEFTLTVKNGQAVFSNTKQKPGQAIVPGAETGKRARNLKVIFPGQSEPEKIVKGDVPKDWFTTTTFTVQNLCTITIIGYSDPFLGMCLKAKQVTSKRITAPTGNLQAAFGYDLDADSIATGKNRKWAVLDKAIPEGMDTLKIYNENLVLANTGIKVTKIFKNRTSLGYLIVNDEFSYGKKKVKTISPGSTQKVDFYLGWNVMAVQYKDENGYPKQAVLLFLVTDKAGVVNLTQKSGKGDSISESKLEIK